MAESKRLVRYFTLSDYGRPYEVVAPIFVTLPAPIPAPPPPPVTVTPKPLHTCRLSLHHTVYEQWGKFNKVCTMCGILVPNKVDGTEEHYKQHYDCVRKRCELGYFYNSCQFNR